jgi:hypothetical protein
MAVDHNRSPDAGRADSALWPGMFAALALGVVVVLCLAELGTHRATGTTARLEQLASQIDQVKTIQPETARQLEALMDMPQYDCARIACSGELNDRNRAARMRLRQAIDSKTRAPDFLTAGHARD